MVISKLGAAVVVRETEDAVDTFSTGLRIKAIYNLLDDTVDTAYSGYYPNFISYTGLAVRTEIAFESTFATFAMTFLDWFPLHVGIVELTFEIGLDVMVVEERAESNVMLGMSDGETILDDVLTLPDVLECKLMPCRDVGNQGENDPIYIYLMTLLQRADSHSNIVGRVDFNIFFH